MNLNFKQKINIPTEQLIRRCGYGLVADQRASQRSYARRMGSGFYPRFHMYINSEDPLILSIHIDQKQVSYKGQSAHSGDYDSEYVKREAQRIYNTVLTLVKQNLENNSQSLANEQDDQAKGGFFSRLFGK